VAVDGAGREYHRYDEVIPTPGLTGDPGALALYAGQAVGLSAALEPAEHIVAAIAAQARELLSGRPVPAPAERYVRALLQGDIEGVLATLHPDAEFTSPFHTWRGPQLQQVYAARRRAFGQLAVGSVTADRDRAVIHWQAEVGAARVEACEILSFVDGAVGSVDVFLSPADVLTAVQDAMTEAWPRPR
jgi:hypothetical protein